MRRERMDPGSLTPRVEPEGQETPPRSRAGFYLRVGKRLLDLSLAAVGLVALSPVLCACAVAIRLTSRGPIFFRQWRVGQHGRLFRLLKFRTMVHSPSAEGPRLTGLGDPRITPIGRWLRKTKLDEIPQLVNVLKGEMSLVGPRPEVPEYVSSYTPDQTRILELKPGVTSPAAIAFVDEEEVLGAQAQPERYYLTTLMPLKIKYDLAYFDGASFSGDVKLILLTLIRLVLPGRGVRTVGGHTGPPLP